MDQSPGMAAILRVWFAAALLTIVGSLPQILLCSRLVFADSNLDRRHSHLPVAKVRAALLPQVVSSAGGWAAAARSPLARCLRRAFDRDDFADL